MDTIIDPAVADHIANDIFAIEPLEWDGEWRHDDAALSVLYRRVRPATAPDAVDMLIHVRGAAPQDYSCVFHARATACSDWTATYHLQPQVCCPGPWRDHLATLAQQARAAAATLAPEEDEPFPDAVDPLVALCEFIENLGSCPRCQEEQA